MKADSSVRRKDEGDGARQAERATARVVEAAALSEAEMRG